MFIVAAPTTVCKFELKCINCAYGHHVPRNKRHGHDLHVLDGSPDCVGGESHGADVGGEVKHNRAGSSDASELAQGAALSLEDQIHNRLYSCGLCQNPGSRGRE